MHEINNSQKLSNMRKLLLSVLLCLTSVVAWAQETVAPPTDATYYDYVLSGVATWPEQGTEDLQDNVVVAVKGNDVYVNGLCGMLPQAWVKGVRNGSNVTFCRRTVFRQRYGIRLWCPLFRRIWRG